MNAWDCYIALCKGYCALVVLVLPRSYSKGGYGFAAVVMIISGILQCIAAIRLAASAMNIGIIDYGKLAERAMGSTGKYLTDLMIVLVQFSLTMSYPAFIASAW